MVGALALVGGGELVQVKDVAVVDGAAGRVGEDGV